LDETTSRLEWAAHPLVDVIEDWRASLQRLVVATPQDIDFVTHWHRHVNEDCMAVTARSARGLEFVLPLELIRKGPLQIARLPGGSHANANFAAASESVSSRPAAEIAASVQTAVRNHRPAVDAILLERLVETLNGCTNPLVTEDSGISPNVALSFTLKQAFAEVLKDRNGAKKQKKMRQMQRRMEDRGGWRVFRSETESECVHVLNRFFKLKGERLKSMGLADVFADPKVQSFFKSLYIGALNDPSRRYELHALEVGGAIAAVGGCTLNGKHLTVEFGGIMSDDRQLSPGDILYHLLIEQCCQRGLETFDFGVGDEFYKRRWCDVETWHHDTFIPLTVKGHVAVSMLKQIAALKKSIKNNPKLFGLIKRLRGKAKAPEQD
jgi:CelD/BcsL family acetyltransferase involved in cellulose biosynthesis